MSAPVRMSAHVTDTDEVAAVVARDLGYDVRLTAEEMTYHHEAVIGDVVSQSAIVVDADLTCAVAPNDLVMLVLVRAGSYQVDPWGETREYGAQTAFVLPPGQAINLEVHRAEIATTVFPARSVQEVAREAFDHAEDELRRSAPRRPSPHAIRGWTQGVRFYRDQILLRPELYQDDLLRDEATRNLIASTIATFDLVDTRDMTASETAAVRRARAYIDDHLHEPLTIQDIAHAARLSPRGIQLAFRRQRGQTPMGYLRQGRLAGAHAELTRADPVTGVTVGSIAASWGFSNQGRFSTSYRSVYGVTPNTTLQG